jgi:hypothetical protein
VSDTTRAKFTFTVEVEVPFANGYYEREKTLNNLTDRIRKAVAEYPSVSALRVEGEMKRL